MGFDVTQTSKRVMTPETLNCQVAAVLILRALSPADQERRTLACAELKEAAASWHP